MAIVSISQQPAVNALKAAYRPIMLKTVATRTDGNPVPPVVYCDIYIGGIFYKTLSKTQYSSVSVGDSEWTFDISDALQEVLSYTIPLYGESLIKLLPNNFRQVYVKFRSSGFDAAGFILPEGTSPVQGTGGNPPVAGTGTQSNTFYVINSTLQHTESQDLATHLNSLKSLTWANHTYPLTHRPKDYLLCFSDNDYYPIIYMGDDGLKGIRITYTYDGMNFVTLTHNYDVSELPNIQVKGLYNIPNGLLNLSTLFPVDFNYVKKYNIEVLDVNDVIVAGWENTIGCCCNSDLVRIHFLNYLGTFDAINFDKPKILHEASASEYVKSLKSPLLPTDSGSERFGVKANDTYEARNKCYKEADMNWVQELIDSPKVFSEYIPPPGAPITNYFYPIVMLNGKLEKQKNDREFIYDFIVQFKLSNDFITIRN
jgi:hypothetical protein